MTAFNFTTMTEYSGANGALEGNGDIPAFATFKQLQSQGYSVNKGAKGVKIFCGYRKQIKEGVEKSVPCFGFVFDIIDTSAAADKDFLQWLKSEIKAGKLKKSQVAVDTIIATAAA